MTPRELAKRIEAGEKWQLMTPTPPQEQTELLTDADIVDIRDGFLPSQGEHFDCVAFARELLRRASMQGHSLGGQPVSSVKDTHHLTPEREAYIRSKISLAYVDRLGTESNERATLLGEIDRLRAEVAELAQQRGDLLALVIDMRDTLSEARKHIQAARDELYACHADPDGAVDALGQAGLDEDDEMLNRIDLALWSSVASDSQPSEMPK